MNRECEIHNFDFTYYWDYWLIGNALTSHKPSLWALRICLFEIKTQRSTHWLRYVLSTKLENRAKANCIYLLVHSSSQFTGNINYPVSIKVKKIIFAVQNSSHHRSITNGLHQNQIRIRCMVLTSLASTECTVMTSQIHCIERWDARYRHQKCIILNHLNMAQSRLYMNTWTPIAYKYTALISQIHCIEIRSIDIRNV